ncbi:MAG: S8 family serine peptidase [Chloroflexi bacterium]|nr:S8 family serine peptidase [Chloroflexota bacterium]
MKRSASVLFLLTLVVLLLGLVALRPGVTQAAAWQDKVDPWVLATAAAQPQTEFLVYLTEQADLSGAAALRSKEAKGQYVVDQLTAVAAQTQPALIQFLDAAGAEYQPFWIANMLWVRGDQALIESLALRLDVAHLYANPTVHSVDPTPLTQQEIESIAAIEWGITLVNADDVWAAGYTGQTIVIGGQDTGYDWDHPALIGKYRGWNGSAANHNYNWHDAIHVGGSSCGADSPFPCDDNGHGTHTMGTMVGDDGGANQIGMAPGATWIGCRNMNAGDGTPATYAECYQWFIAPTDLSNQNPDTSKAPHVINNSWGCPVSEGCTDPNVLLTVVNNVRAAGIVTVHSAGNSGSSCSTIDTPAAIYDSSFTVGATNSSDTIASFSSRGPVLVDGSGRAKPDISAPGVSIRSSLPGTGYGSLSGTSMAGPHVAGMVALLLSARPDLAGQVDAIEAVIMATAVPRTTAQNCGSIPGSQVPNNTYGWGRIDVLAAYNALQSQDQELFLLKEVSQAEVLPGDVLTYTLTITQTGPQPGVNNLVLTDTLPTGVTFITATLPFSQTGEVIGWDRASLTGQDVWSVELVVAVPLTTTLTAVHNETYGVVGDGVTAVSGPTVSTLIQTPPPPQLYLNKEVSAAIVDPGDTLTYTLTVTQSSVFTDVANLVLTDTLPVGVTFITATLPFTQDGETIIWDRASLAAGDVWAVELVVEVPLLTEYTAVHNEMYGVVGDGVTAVSGPTVSSLIAPWFKLYVPAVYFEVSE